LVAALRLRAGGAPLWVTQVDLSSKVISIALDHDFAKALATEPLEKIDQWLTVALRKALIFGCGYDDCRRLAVAGDFLRPFGSGQVKKSAQARLRLLNLPTAHCHPYSLTRQTITSLSTRFK